AAHRDRALDVDLHPADGIDDVFESGHVDRGPVVEVEPERALHGLHRRPHSGLESMGVADFVLVLLAPLPHGVDEVLGGVAGGAEPVGQASASSLPSGKTGKARLRGTEMSAALPVLVSIEATSIVSGRVPSRS